MNLFILVYFLFQDENNFINPLLQVGTESNEKSNDPAVKNQWIRPDPDPHP